MTSTIHSITIDCAKPMALARFWAEVLGTTLPPHTEKDLEWLRAQGIDDPEDDPIIALKSPAGGAPRLLFIQVPEGKQVKNRVHLDLQPDTTMAAEVERLVAVGATVQADFSGELGTWTVLTDPEGNEFCVERSQAERDEERAAASPT